MIPRLHVVTDDRVLARSDFRRRAREVLEAGGPNLALHLRGPETAGRVVFEYCADLEGPARSAGALLMVNDRVDVALACGLPGAHLPGRGMPTRDARALLGREVVLGRSVHDVDEARRAEAEGVDLLLLGTIFSTASHPERPGAGVDLVGRVRTRTRVPLVAIGGIDETRVGPVREAGGDGVAVLRAVWDRSRVGRAVVGLLEALDEGTLPRSSGP